MYYYALINLGLGEIGPSNPIELGFCSLSMVISSIFFTYVFSTIATLHSQINTSTINQEEIINKINDAMSRLDLSQDLRSSINYYILKTRPLREFQNNLNFLMSDLPWTQQTKIMGCSFRPAFLANKAISLFLIKMFTDSPTLITQIKYAQQIKYQVGKVNVIS